MTIPRAHRKWLVIFAVSVVVWVGASSATYRKDIEISFSALNQLVALNLDTGKSEFYVDVDVAPIEEVDLRWSIERLEEDWTKTVFGEWRATLFPPLYFDLHNFLEADFAIDLPFWLLPLTVLIAWGAWTWRAKRRGERDEVDVST